MKKVWQNRYLLPSFTILGNSETGERRRRSMHDFTMKINEYLPLREVVFNTLRDAILKGELKPGEHLMEVQLANKLGVSRTPIREAIRQLEAEGLVVMTPRKGAVVAEITKEDLTDVLEVRKTLEKFAVELACSNINNEELERLHQCHEIFKSAFDSGELTVIANKDEEFHDVIYGASRNKRLIQILNNLREQIYRYRLEYIKDEEKRFILIDEHDKLINAIENKDVATAKEVIEAHIDNQEQTILENLKK